MHLSRLTLSREDRIRFVSIWLQCIVACYFVTDTYIHTRLAGIILGILLADAILE